MCPLQPDTESVAETNLLAMMAQIIGLAGKTSNLDTMMLEEVLKEQDREQSIEPMYKELMDLIERKQNAIGKIVKWKDWLCTRGCNSVEPVNYWLTYSPVVSWSTIQLAIILALIIKWHVQSVDFILLFPQAPVQTDIYVKPPQVPLDFKIQDLPKLWDRHTSMYQVLHDLYGLKNAGRTLGLNICTLVCSSMDGLNLT